MLLIGATRHTWFWKACNNGISHSFMMKYHESKLANYLLLSDHQHTTALLCFCRIKTKTETEPSALENYQVVLARGSLQICCSP